MTLIRRVLRNLVLFLLAFWLAAQFVPADPVPDHAFFQNNPAFESIAHGLGEGPRPNNTLAAASHAVAAGTDILEMDIHLSKDNILVVRHDATIDATTNGSGRIMDMDYATLSGFDAGYRFDPDQDGSFPWRGKGVIIPTLDSILTAFPGHRFMIEMKPDNPAIAEPFCAMIRDHGLQDQVMAASFHDTVLQTFRETCPEVATSMGKSEIRNLVLASKIGLGHLLPVRGIALQVPTKVSFLSVTTASFVKAMQDRNLRVHVWTINDPDVMHDLTAMGVDGIITDFPRRVIKAWTGRAAQP